MKFPSIFKTPQHKRFNIRTRYYDAEKEAFEERVKAAMAQQQGDDANVAAVKERIRSSYQSRRKAGNRSENSKRILRIMIILGGLLFLFYILLK